MKYELKELKAMLKHSIASLDKQDQIKYCINQLIYLHECLAEKTSWLIVCPHKGDNITIGGTGLRPKFITEMSTKVALNTGLIDIVIEKLEDQLEEALK